MSLRGRDAFADPLRSPGLIVRATEQISCLTSSRVIAALLRCGLHGLPSMGSVWAARGVEVWG